MKRVVNWRPPLWLVVVFMGCTLALGTGAGYVQGAAQRGECTESAEICAKFNNFWEVWNIAEDRFVDPSALNPDDMIAGAINGMLDTLNDQGHTRYNTPEEYTQERESLNGEFEGIGAYIGQEGNYPMIVAPIEGSPAEAAGIRAGDIILKVDGVSTENMDSEDVVRRVRGAPGTTVTLEIQHLDEEAPVDITITRAAITVPAVTWRMLPDNVAHIRLSRFTDTVAPDLERALAEAKQQGATRILLDLRNNPGGYLNQAIGVVSQFVERDEVVLRIRNRDGSEEVQRAAGYTPDTTTPMVVLINSGSASASEITAGALQDLGRAQVIGVQTPGLGTVVQPFELDDGSALYLGVQEWLTPEGRALRHQGVEPDIEVTLPGDVQPLTPSSSRDLSDEEILRTEDTQVQKALELLGVRTTAQAYSPIVAR